MSLFVSNSSVISVSSSSAAENRKLGRPREGDELEGELFLRRSLFEKKERFWVINRKTGRNKTIKFKTLSKMHKIEFWLMKSYVKYISCFVLEIASLNKIVKLLFLPLSFCNFSLSLLIFDVCGLGQLFHFISYSWFL